jgi:hypothetical protein
VKLSYTKRFIIPTRFRLHPHHLGCAIAEGLPNGMNGSIISDGFPIHPYKKNTVIRIILEYVYINMFKSSVANIANPGHSHHFQRHRAHAVSPGVALGFSSWQGSCACK